MVEKKIVSSNFKNYFLLVLLCHPASVLGGTGEQGDTAENKAKICILLEQEVNVLI